MTRILTLVLVLVLAGLPARAQDAYPTRPLTLVVPFPPGGVADLTARPLAAALERVLKQPVGVVKVPTLKELGYDVEYYLWTALFAPRGRAAPRVRDAA